VVDFRDSVFDMKTHFFTVMKTSVFTSLSPKLCLRLKHDNFSTYLEICSTITVEPAYSNLGYQVAKLIALHYCLENCPYMSKLIYSFQVESVFNSAKGEESG